MRRAGRPSFSSDDVDVDDNDSVHHLHPSSGSRSYRSDVPVVAVLVADAAISDDDDDPLAVHLPHLFHPSSRL